MRIDSLDLLIFLAILMMLTAIVLDVVVITKLVWGW